MVQELYIRLQMEERIPELLTRYLFERHRLDMPGIGELSVVQRHANADIAQRSINPPGWGFTFLPRTEDTQSGPRDVSQWIAAQLNISSEEADKRFMSFCGELQNKLANGEAFEWEGVGVFATERDRVVFSPGERQWSPFTPVNAQKVIREDASHQVLVGDMETSTSQMLEQLRGEEKRRSTMSKIAWGLLAFSLAALIWFWISNGCSLAASANRQKAGILKAPETYRLR